MKKSSFRRKLTTNRRYWTREASHKGRRANRLNECEKSSHSLKRDVDDTFTSFSAIEGRVDFFQQSSVSLYGDGCALRVVLIIMRTSPPFSNWKKYRIDEVFSLIVGWGVLWGMKTGNEMFLKWVKCGTMWEGFYNALKMLEVSEKCM